MHAPLRPTLVLFGLLLALPLILRAQTISVDPVREGGREFWVVFQKNFRDSVADQPATKHSPQKMRPADSLTLALVITAGSDANGYVEIPGLGKRTPFGIKGGEMVVVPVDRGAEVVSDGVVEKLGVHVVADAPVMVYGSNHRLQTTDTYLAYPVDLLGKSYRAACYRWLQSDLLAQVAVVATEDGTTVRFTPSAPVVQPVPSSLVGPVSGREPIELTLNRGEVYQIIAKYDPGTLSDLTGTLVTADKPVALFSGHNCAYVPNSSTKACNLLVEQMPPISTWGHEHYVGRLATRTSSVVRVIASEDSTVVSINRRPVATLNAGEFYEDVHQRDPMAITADRPVLVVQLAQGYDNGDEMGDPMMTVIAPVTQYNSSYRFATPLRGSWRNFANVIVPLTSIGDLRLDGAPVADSLFRQIGTSPWAAGAITVEEGAHTITCGARFGFSCYGFGADKEAYDAYGHAGGYMVEPLAR
jgi:hypothetical protein